MVAADTSTLVAFLRGDSGADVERFDEALVAAVVVLPPVVITECLSAPDLPPTHRRLILRFPVLEVLDGYWVRTAATRAVLLSRKLRARLADTLIAQSCIDHDVALIARNGDFRHFATHCDLRLV